MSSKPIGERVGGVGGHANKPVTAKEQKEQERIDEALAALRQTTEISLPKKTGFRVWSILKHIPGIGTLADKVLKKETVDRYTAMRGIKEMAGEARFYEKLGPVDLKKLTPAQFKRLLTKVKESGALEDSLRSLLEKRIDGARAKSLGPITVDTRQSLEENIKQLYCSKMPVEWKNEEKIIAAKIRVNNLFNATLLKDLESKFGEGVKVSFNTAFDEIWERNEESNETRFTRILDVEVDGVKTYVPLSIAFIPGDHSNAKVTIELGECGFPLSKLDEEGLERFTQEELDATHPEEIDKLSIEQAKLINTRLCLSIDDKKHLKLGDKGTKLFPKLKSQARVEPPFQQAKPSNEPSVNEVRMGFQSRVDPKSARAAFEEWKQMESEKTHPTQKVEKPSHEPSINERRMGFKSRANPKTAKAAFKDWVPKEGEEPKEVLREEHNSIASQPNEPLKTRERASTIFENVEPASENSKPLPAGAFVEEEFIENRESLPKLAFKSKIAEKINSSNDQDAEYLKFNQKEIQSIPEEDLRKMDMHKFGSEQISFLTKKQIAALTEKQWKQLSMYHIRALTRQQIQWLGPKVKWFNTVQISRMQIEQFEAMSLDQLKSMSINQLKMININVPRALTDVKKVDWILDAQKKRQSSE